MTALTPREQVLYDTLKLCRDFLAAAATMGHELSARQGSDTQQTAVELDQLVITADAALATCAPAITAEQLQAAADMVSTAALAEIGVTTDGVSGD